MQFNDKYEELGDLAMQVLSEAIGDKSALEDEARLHRQDLENQRLRVIAHSGVADLEDFTDAYYKFRQMCDNYAHGDDDRMKAIVAPLMKAFGETDAILRPYYQKGKEELDRKIGENSDLQKKNADDMLKAASQGASEQPTIPGV